MQHRSILIVTLFFSAYLFGQPTDHKTLHTNLLNNVWTDSDYEMYLPKEKNTKEAFIPTTTPAFFKPITAQTIATIAGAIVFAPNANSVFRLGKKEFIDSKKRSIITIVKEDGLWLLASYAYEVLDIKQPESRDKNVLVNLEELARKNNKAVFKSALGLLFITEKVNPYLSQLSRDIQYEILYNILFERPVAKTIIQDLATNTANKHPYIIITNSRVEAIKKLARKDDFASRCYEKVINGADKKISSTPDYTYEYKNPNGGKFATILSDKINVAGLVLAYQLTGETKYAERAIQDMEAICNWPDWGTTLGRQFLGTASICFQMGMGYDGLFNYMTTTQRTRIKEAIVEKAIRPGLFYHYIKDSRIAVAKSNWNAVCNNGLVAVALAIAPEEPELSGRMLENCIGSLENVLSVYAEDGAYEEGPGYWAYGTGALVRALDAIETATGNNYGLSEAPGLSTTAYFVPFMIGPAGYYNFHDAEENNNKFITDPEYFWFANRYNNPDFYWERMRLPEQNVGNIFDLLWYKGKVKGGFNLPLDYFGKGENNSVGTGTFRTSWTDPNALFLGFHAGYRLANHSQSDEGTFIFDALGERWAIDVGDGRRDLSVDGKSLNGSQEKYFGKERPDFYRMRTEGHNLYVINPDKSYGQDFSASNRPQFEQLSLQTEKPFAIANLTCSYKKEVSVAKRGFLLNKKEGYALIQDEAILTQSSTVYWFMHTRANIEIVEDGHAALLSIGKKKLYVKVIGDTTGITFTQMASKGLTDNVINMKNMDDVRKLTIKLDGASKLKFAVALIPLKDGEIVPSKNIVFNDLRNWK
jgi:hypothetical protein